jgi:hypothetical protein
MRMSCRQAAAWFDAQLDLDPERSSFINETWASINIARRHGAVGAVSGCAPAYRMDTGRRPRSSQLSSHRHGRTDGARWTDLQAQEFKRIAMRADKTTRASPS